MTDEEAIYCLEASQPDSLDDMCLKCKYYGSIKVDDQTYICRSSEARQIAINAIKEKLNDKIRH